MTENDDHTQTHMVLAVGTIVGHYRIVEKIGSGGMGDVYLAEDTQLGRKVALKFLPTRYLGDEDLKARFKREAQATATLKHPNIVTIHEVSDYGGRPFFVMEHIEGATLKNFARDKALSTEEILDLVIQICQGLAKAHSSGVTHRDIKPSNIVIDADGRPKIVDFGLATIRGAEKLTKDGSTLGTAGYMSPEQIQNKDTDQRSDIFSVGVVLYELLSGQAPFKGDSEAATLNSVLTVTPEPLSRFKADIPERLQGIMEKVLEKSPSERYQHADDLLVDLRKVSAQIRGIPSGEISSASRAAMRPVTSSRKFGPIVVSAILILAAITGYFIYDQSGSKSDSDSAGEKSAIKTLVVLPFQNLSSSDDEYFADGITDEITSKLAMIKGLRVISRTSAIQYKKSEKSLKEIGHELGVDYILEGTVRWDKSGDVSRVRITPQLIKVADDFHLWANNYERELTQVFAVQSEIATSISEALGVTLLEPEKEAIAAEPTGNLEAYDFYLRGIDYLERFSGRSDVKRAIEMFEKAVELDSAFYQALAQLAKLYSAQYFGGEDRTAEKLALAKVTAKRAFIFAAGRPEGFLAMGYYYYYGERKLDQALEQFDRGLDLQPNNSDVLEAAAYVLRRKGKWDESVSSLSKASRIDPRSLGKNLNLVDSYLKLRRFDLALKAIKRCLALAPDNASLRVYRGFVNSVIQNDFSELWKSIDDASEFAGESDLREWRMTAFLANREFDSVVSMDIDIADFHIQDSSHYYTAKALAFKELNNPERSRAYYDSALVLAENRLAMAPDYAPKLAKLSLVLAGMGRADDAIGMAKRAVEMMPLSEDAFLGADMIFNLARVYALLGKQELALDKLEFLMTIPSNLFVFGLRQELTYDPLRDNPRFKALIKKYENAEAL